MERVGKLLKTFNEKGIDGFFISSVSNITYLTGFTGDSSRLFVSEKRCLLVTDGRYTEQAGKECHPEIEIVQWINDKRYTIDTYEYIVRSLGIKHLGFEAAIITFSEYDVLRKGLDNMEIVPVTGLVEGIRQQKDPSEIDCLRTACEISDKALELTLPYIKEGISELELTARLEYLMKTNGAETLSFETIVLSGARTSFLHGKPGEKKLEKGDLVLFDFGALYKGYHADISRTFILGPANARQKELYGIIQKAQNSAVQSLKPAISGRIPDKEVRNNMPEKYLAHYYPGLGHGVGLQIHEEPFLGQNWDYTLLENMTLTIEPGIYIPGWGGIRIEDTVLIKGDTVESLSCFPRDLMIC